MTGRTRFWTIVSRFAQALEDELAKLPAHASDYFVREAIDKAKRRIAVVGGKTWIPKDIERFARATAMLERIAAKPEPRPLQTTSDFLEYDCHAEKYPVNCSCCQVEFMGSFYQKKQSAAARRVICPDCMRTGGSRKRCATKADQRAT